MRKIKVDAIAKYNLEKPINADNNISRSPTTIVRESDKKLRKALSERIEREVPQELLDKGPTPYSNGCIYKRFHANELQKRMVWQMAAMGASAQIIRLAVIDPETNQPIVEHCLIAHFGDIMRHAREQANFTVALKIYEIAIGHDAEFDQDGNLIRPSSPPNMDALKWWDRTRGEAKKLLDLRTLRQQEQEANTVTLVIEGS